MINQCWLWLFVRKHVDFVRVRWSEIRVHFIPNLRLFIPVIAISLYNAMDTIIMGWLSTMVETGYYQYSYKIVLVPLAVITALGTVMLPRMSSAFANNEVEQGMGLLTSSMWLMLITSYAFMWGVIGVADVFVPVFLGKEFATCAPLVCLLSTIIPLCSVTNVLGIQYLLPTFGDTQYTLSVCIGAVVNLAVSLFLIPTMGAMGSAIGSVSAQFTVLVVQCIYVRTKLPLMSYAKTSFPFFLMGVGMAALLRLLSPAVVSAFGVGTRSLLILVAIGAIMYTLCALAYCNLTKDEQYYRIIVPRVQRLRTLFGRGQ